MPFLLHRYQEVLPIAAAAVAEGGCTRIEQSSAPCGSNESHSLEVTSSQEEGLIWIPSEIDLQLAFLSCRTIHKPARCSAGYLIWIVR